MVRIWDSFSSCRCCGNICPSPRPKPAAAVCGARAASSLRTSLDEGCSWGKMMIWTSTKWDMYVLIYIYLYIDYRHSIPKMIKKTNSYLNSDNLLFTTIFFGGAVGIKHKDLELNHQMVGFKSKNWMRWLIVYIIIYYIYWLILSATKNRL